MKKKKRYTRLYLLILGCILILSFGCEKIMFWKKEAPSVTTFPVTDITLDLDGYDHHGAGGDYYTARSGGNVTDDGNAGVDLRGVVWSKHENPEVNIWKDESGHHQVDAIGEGGANLDGYGTGEFTSKLTFLEPETTYFLRAYAQNSEGIGYGEQVDFQTLPLPVFTLTLFAEPEKGGSVEGAGEYERYEYVDITATPNFGYEFVNWTDEDGNLVRTDPSFSYHMPAEDVTIAANFRVPDGTAGNMSDVEGNVYNTIYIGGVEWMTENLRTTKYDNGTDIFGGLTLTEWEATTDGAWAVYPHEDVDGIDSNQEMLEAYGALYNWYTVETGNLCPAGWRVPTHDDWTTLERYVCTSFDCDTSFPYDNHTTGRRGQYESRSLKDCRQINYTYGGECSTDEHPRWDQSSQYGDNDYGFSGLPAGLLHPQEGFDGSIGESSVWWSSTAPSASVAWIRMMNYNSDGIVRDGSNKAYGFSVRCIRE